MDTIPPPSPLLVNYTVVVTRYRGLTLKVNFLTAIENAFSLCRNVENNYTYFCMGVKIGHKVVLSGAQCYALTRYFLLPLYCQIFLNLTNVVGTSTGDCIC